MNRLIVLIFFVFTFFHSLNAQIAPPRFSCVLNDTLKWEPALETCGAFRGVVIFGSRSVDGPFSVLGTVTDPDKNSFFHEQTLGERWFYFLQSDYDCPGLMPLNSDTLDNRIPEVSIINYVTVRDNGVEVQWNPSASPETFGYIIYRGMTTGTTIIDTVFSATTYRDTTASPDKQSEIYFVNSLDPCGNVSLFSNSHKTMLVSIESIGSCDQAVNLKWNPYEAWPGGLKEQQVWVSVNGGTFTQHAVLPKDVLSYSFQNVNDKDEYCYFISAVQADDPNITSASNVVCQTIDVVQPAKDFDILNASFTPENQVEVTWTWDPTSEIKSYNIQRGVDTINFALLEEKAPDNPLVQRKTFLDADLEQVSRQLFYKVEAEDDCGKVAVSKLLPIIYLKVDPQSGGLNKLAWTPYQNRDGAFIRYEIHRITGGVDEVVHSEISISNPTFNDRIEITDPQQVAACYYIEAVSTLTLPDNNLESTRTRSNTVCVEQQAQVFVPNAFVPDGFNSTFKPILQFGVPEDYLMVIYDRWGGKIFESTDLDVGWNGNKEEQPLPQGVYAYYIKVMQSGGKVTEVKGAVLLLR